MNAARREWIAVDHTRIARNNERFYERACGQTDANAPRRAERLDLAAASSTTAAGSVVLN
jgi:hypothetical protein